MLYQTLRVLKLAAERPLEPTGPTDDNFWHVLLAHLLKDGLGFILTLARDEESTLIEIGLVYLST